MGARIHYVFKDVEAAIGEPSAHVVLYSHWGETEWQRDIAMSLLHSKPRWSDASYFTRMMISYLTQDSVFSETGFGIYAIKDIDEDLGDTKVIIDITKETIIDNYGNVLDWQLFIEAYLPNVSAEQIAMVGSPSV
jgi:hypothetical protein